MDYKSNSRKIIASLLVLFMVLPCLSFFGGIKAKAYGETFIIDPGHGGRDPGALGSDPYREEADDTLRLSLRVGEIVSQYTTVTYTRTTDKYLELAERSSMANSGNHKYLISIHRNSFTDPTAKGLSIFYHNSLSSTSPSALFATAVYNSVLEKVPFWSRGVKSENFHMVREPKMPSCLIETGFISNNNDNAIFDQYFEEIAFGIAKGMLSMIGITPDASNTKSNKLEGVSPLYLGENFVAWIRQSATGNYLTDKDGYLVSAEGKFDETQRWHFFYNSDDGSYSILNEAKEQWVDVPYANYADNQAIWLCDYNGLEPQRFYVYFTRGHFFFRTVGSKKVFDVNAYTNNLELCGEDTGTNEVSLNARAFEILKFNNDYSNWYYNFGQTTSVFVRNPASGLLMTAEGSSVVFKEATYGDEQKWVMEKRADGSYEFKSVSTGLNLDVLYGELKAGTTVDLCAYNGLRPQSFYILPSDQGNGYYYIKPCYTHTVCHMDGTALDMTLQELNKTDSTALNAQMFEIVTDGIVNNTYAPTYFGDDFYGYLTGKASGTTITDMGGHILAQPTTYADNQLLHFQYDKSTLTYKITGASGKCIDVTFTLHSDGSTIGMYDDNGWAAQRFRFYEINGYVYISPYYTNRLVDINSSDKSTIQLYGTELSDTRAFTLTKKDNSIKTELVIKNGSTLSKDGTYLMGVALGKTVKDVISQFDNENLSIYDFKGNALSSSAKVGTGCIVKLTVNGKVVDSLTVIVKGDVTGEGAVDGTDYLRIKGEFIGTYKLEGAFAKAADVDGNENIDGTDYLRVKSIFLGTN